MQSLSHASRPLNPFEESKQKGDPILDALAQTNKIEDKEVDNREKLDELE